MLLRKRNRIEPGARPWGGPHEKLAGLGNYLVGMGLQMMSDLSEMQAPIFGVTSPVAGDVDGFTLATRVRQTYADVDVILTSGISGAADKAHDLCEDGPIRKPYHPKDVAARIKVLRERRRASNRA